MIDYQVEKYMEHFLQTIKKYVKDETIKVDIYNRGYEALSKAISDYENSPKKEDLKELIIYWIEQLHSEYNYVFNEYQKININIDGIIANKIFSEVKKRIIDRLKK